MQLPRAVNWSQASCWEVFGFLLGLCQFHLPFRDFPRVDESLFGLNLAAGLIQ